MSLDFGEVEAEDFGNFGGGAAAVGFFAPEAITNTRSRAARTACALVGAGAGNRLDGESVDAAVGVPAGDARGAGVHDGLHAVDG